MARGIKHRVSSTYHCRGAAIVRESGGWAVKTTGPNGIVRVRVGFTTLEEAKEYAASRRVGRVTLNNDNWTAYHALRIYEARLSDETREEITRRVDEGEQQTDIARSMGLPIRRVSDLMYHQRQARQRELPQSIPDPKFDVARHMWEDGKTMKEIATAYRYSFMRMKGVIQHYRKRFGWFPNRWYRGGKT